MNLLGLECTSVTYVFSWWTWFGILLYESLEVIIKKQLPKIITKSPLNELIIIIKVLSNKCSSIISCSMQFLFTCGWILLKTFVGGCGNSIFSNFRGLRTPFMLKTEGFHGCLLNGFIFIYTGI